MKVQEEVYLTLKKELEISKIEEVKKLPMVRVLDEARPSITKSKPERRLIMSISIFVAFTVGIIAAFLTEYVVKLYSD